MGVLNGADHLRAQLASIAAQRHRNWHLRCSDDGSRDGSIGILRAFAVNHPGRVSILSGPGSGFAENYLFLLRTLPREAGHVAFADQDDIWLPDKLSRALSAIGHTAAPTLYCGRRLIWYPETDRRLQSPATIRPCTLRNALVENIAPGNTIVLNPAAAALARMAARRTGSVFAHDWWLYQLITAAGGRVQHDNGPAQVLYRQHRHNRIGAGRGWKAQTRRKRGVLQGDYAGRITANIAALRGVEDLLTPSARHLIAAFDGARHLPPLGRLAALRGLAPYRQRFRDNLGLWGAASLGRI